MRLIDADRLMDRLRGNVLIDVTPELEDEVAKQPTAQQWVPVEERMPDKPGDYWVTMRHLDGSATTEKMTWCPDWIHKDAWNEVVVAWQPYYCPEPFNSQN